MPVPRNDVKSARTFSAGRSLCGHQRNVAGRAGATDHDVTVAKKLAYVMCGGDLSEQSLVSEQYLLDLEREAFLGPVEKRKHWKEYKAY